MKDLYKLPDDLPVPVDDGACNHLRNFRVPSIQLQSTSGATINPGEMTGTTVLFFYPMTGKPESPPMIGWNDIPGARGCTPQTCSFRDNFSNLENLGVTVYGVSSQSSADQKEASDRLALPYELLSDSDFELVRAMNLPTFRYQSSTFIKRITVIARDGVIVKTFYPVFPPDKNVDDVIVWLEQNPAIP